jgi:hypothetical protein
VQRVFELTGTLGDLGLSGEAEVEVERPEAP